MTALLPGDTITTVLVDDEEPARELLRAFLARWPQVRIVGEAGDGQSAVDLIRATRPALAFLDVQMPGMSGIEVAGSFAHGEMPLFVFVTAYDRYALQAFEVSACDYLLKPFDAPRLAATMQRVLLRLHDAARPAQRAAHELLRALGLARPVQVVVKVDGRHLFLDPVDVEWIEAVGKDARLHVAGTGHREPLLVRESMQSLEQRLDPSMFVRVHRSAIINRRHIRELQPWVKGDYVIILRRGARVVSGRTYKDVVQQLLAPATRRDDGIAAW